MGHNFKELKVWQKAIDLAEKIYKVSANFPADERFGLTSQIRRASVSVASNIAEGSGRGTKKQFAYFLAIALASAYEVETQLIIAQKLKCINDNDFEEISSLLTEVQKMLFAFSKTIKL
jgi:four helix bundle protein